MFQILAVSLGLGLLVGLQRERSDSALGGIRTFPLITLLGTVMALLAQELPEPAQGVWLLAAGFLGVAAVTVSENIRPGSAERKRGGITTEIAILAMYALGAFLVYGPLSVAAVVAGVIVLLLHAKELLHRLTGRIGEKDMRAIMTFVLISLVVLPAVPDYAIQSAWGLNPRNVWLMVVLVVGMSLAGYVLFKMVRPEAGTVLAGVFGGLVSSTATTVSYARRSRGSPGAAASAATVILIASTVVYGRVAVEMGLVSPSLLRAAAWPLGIVMLVSAGTALASWFGSRGDSEALPEPENPTELKTALIFAAMYAGVFVATGLARDYLGDWGVFATAAISGLTDMDAITLSVSRMASREELEMATAWRAVLVAAAANVVFKAALASTLGGPELRRRLALFMGIQFAAIVALAVLWPSGTPQSATIGLGR